MYTSTAAAPRADVRGTSDLLSSVHSATRADVRYTVTIGLDGVYTCTCPAGEHGFAGCKRLGHCKHVEAELRRYAALARVGSRASALKMYDEVVECRSCGARRHAVTVEQVLGADHRTWTTICGCGARSTLDLASPGAAFVN